MSDEHDWVSHPVNQYPSSKAVRPNNVPALDCVESSTQDDGMESTNEFWEQVEEAAGFGEEEIEGDAEESADDDQEEGDHAGSCDKPEKPDRGGDHDAEAEGDDAVDPDQAPALGEEEVQPPQVAAQPQLPCRDQIDVHEAMGHAQYRSWCEACIHGQGREDRHL